MLRSGNGRTRMSGRLNRSMGRGNRMDTEPSAELITVQAAADRLAVSRWMVFRLIWDQQVKSVQIGRCRRIVRQSFEDYLAA
jgi:excisionase family DNA binding protein